MRFSIAIAFSSFLACLSTAYANPIEARAQRSPPGNVNVTASGTPFKFQYIFTVTAEFRDIIGPVAGKPSTTSRGWNRPSTDTSMQHLWEVITILLRSRLATSLVLAQTVQSPMELQKSTTVPTTAMRKPPVSHTSLVTALLDRETMSWEHPQGSIANVYVPQSLLEETQLPVLTLPQRELQSRLWACINPSL